jgi:hypothetical protein
MLLDTKIWRDGRWWIGEVPILDASTQGHSRKELLDMLADLVVTVIEEEKASVSIVTVKEEVFVEVRPSSTILPAILMRQRMKAGLSIREVAKKMGYANHNNYAAYESGRIQTSFEKFQELLRGIVSQNKDAHDPIALRLVVGA